jgi:hypothetical protein
MAVIAGRAAGVQVDPISVAAVVAVLTKVFDGAAEEAGRRAWESLTGLVRRAYGKDGAARKQVDAQPEPTGDSTTIEALARALVAEAHTNPGVAAELRQWMDASSQQLTAGGVRNTIHGNVYGKVVQIDGDVHGGINL